LSTDGPEFHDEGPQTGHRPSVLIDDAAGEDRAAYEPDRDVRDPLAGDERN